MEIIKEGTVKTFVDAEDARFVLIKTYAPDGRLTAGYFIPVHELAAWLEMFEQSGYQIIHTINS